MSCVKSDDLRKAAGMLRRRPNGRKPVGSRCPDPVDLSTTLDQALQIMEAAQSVAVAVVQDRVPLGVLSRRQIHSLQCREAVAGKSSARKSSAVYQSSTASFPSSVSY